MKRYYVEIDSNKYEENGEIDIISAPQQWEYPSDTPDTKKSGIFEIHRPKYLCKFIRTVGGQRGVVAEHLLKRKDGQNKILITNRELAATTGVSLATTNDLLRDLRNAGCIKCRTAAVMVNPGIAHKGNRQREAVLMKLYNSFDSRADK